MVVTIIADVLGEENNGTTIACMNLVRYCQSRGDTVKIVCADQDKKDIPGYFVVPLNKVLSWMAKRNKVTIAKVDRGVIERAIEGSDIVHCMIPFPLARMAMKICREKDIPCTAGFHMQAENFSSHFGFLMNCGVFNYFVYQNCWNHFYKYVDAIHYPTEFIRKVFESTIEERTNGYVISNGVNDRFFNKQIDKPAELKDKFVILSTGRFSIEKAQKVLIKAVKYSKYKDKIQLILAGTGPLENKFKKISKKCCTNQPIMKFFGRDEIVDVINYSDLYCHTAVAELEVIACLEALKCGLVPVIANSNRCATKYFARDEKCLFKANKAKDLASKIDFWIEHPEMKEEYKKYYIENSAIYDQTECMRETRNMLIEAIRCRKNKKERSYITVMN